MNRLRLLTINIWNRQGPWDKRLALLRAGVRALDPDIVGLQEVLNMPQAGPDQAENIAEGLGYHVAYGPASFIGGSCLSMGNAILSRWPIAAREHWELPHEGDDGRCLLHARVDSPHGAIPVFVTHLSWQFHLGHAREQQVRLINDRVHEKLDDAMLPAVLMGDFNAEPDSDEIRFLRGLTSLGGRSTYWADCFGLCGEGRGDTFTRTNGYSTLQREPPRRLDYIFVRGPDRNLRGEPLAARVVLDKPEGDVWPSDHYGVYAEVSI